MFPDCIVLKNDANYLQGIPDILILFKNRWAALEIKASEGSKTQPNQEYYVDKMKEMSYAAFVHPANRELILEELDYLFG